MKPFKPPTLVSKPYGPSQPLKVSSEPPTKRRKISRESEDDAAEVVAAAANILKQSESSQLKRSDAAKTFRDPARKPLDIVSSNQPAPQPSQNASFPEAYYNVLWRKFTTKKNKTWDGDGVLEIRNGNAILKDDRGKELGRAANKGPLLVGSELSLSGRVVEVESMISKDDYLAGRPFLGNVKATPQPLKEIDETTRVTAKAQIRYDKIAGTQKERLNPVSGASKAAKAVFKAPTLNNTVQSPKRDTTVPAPRHDPKATNALVMKRPTSAPKGKHIVDVVVDPLISRSLRDYQRDGVSFLYECVMGLKDYGGEGAVLADEMGLGKTLQTTALLWTLLKQNPISEASPVARKALIVCPATLVLQWRREIWKWLGKDRIGIFIAESKKARISDFTMGKAYSIMIVGYEKLRKIQDELRKGDNIDIIIADEGHRLKTAQNKSAQAINSLNVTKKVVLSGTPIQNDLAEFYFMVDFVNPGLLKKYPVFKREFETPILKSRQPGASEGDLEKGEARSKELSETTSMFILRRTQEVMLRFLPPKTDYILFCKPTVAQCSVYEAITGSPVFSNALGSYNTALELINVLSKVCSSPSLLLKKDEKGQSKTRPELLECIPQSLLKPSAAGGKLQVLKSVLERIRTTSEEKVVLISNYTSTMDVLASLITGMSYNYLRLDGSTAANKRQDIVTRFNNTPASKFFVFLLSKKAGGVGLNLTGASRLILFDLDWNPASDLQAMSRIHRDGQKRPCFIYRLVTKGTIDEKIFQRQVGKVGLADSLVDGKDSASDFTSDELRDLFTLDDTDGCQTHNLIRCGCGGNGMPMSDQDEEEGRNDLAILSSSDDQINLNDDGVGVVRLDDEDVASEFKGGAWTNAKHYDWKAEETSLRRGSSDKLKMLSLMQYAHFDASAVEAGRPKEPMMSSKDSYDGDEDDVSMADPLEGIIEDGVLRSVLRDEGNRVSFVFSKLSG